MNIFIEPKNHPFWKECTSGYFLKWWFPHFTPQKDLVGKPMVVGYHHFRKHPSEPNLHQLGVSKNSGTPKWMVYKMENPIEMDDLGVPPCSETPIWTKPPSIWVQNVVMFPVLVVSSFFCSPFRSEETGVFISQTYIPETNFPKP